VQVVKILVVLTNILDIVHINRYVFTKMFQRLELFPSFFLKILTYPVSEM